MTKLTTLKSAAKFCKTAKQGGKTVGLVVGSFDVVHLGHVNLFIFAKKRVDYLVVALDNDITIKLVKGKNRPIHNFKTRAKFLSAFEQVDKVFGLEHVSHHDSDDAINLYRNLVKVIKPTHIFTHKICDRHWEKKKQVAKDVGVVFVLDKSPRVTNSGVILEKLLTDL